MTKKQLTVRVSSPEESLANFKDVYKRAERGEKITGPVDILSFENESELMKTFSPRRLRLLRILHLLGAVSIQQLAKELRRDYNNVQQDINELHLLRIIFESEEKYYVPWEIIAIEISFCAKEFPKI